jgi:hypothetical protein
VLDAFDVGTGLALSESPLALSWFFVYVPIQHPIVDGDTEASSTLTYLDQVC